MHPMDHAIRWALPPPSLLIQPKLHTVFRVFILAAILVEPTLRMQPHPHRIAEVDILPELLRARRTKEQDLHG